MGNIEPASPLFPQSPDINDTYSKFIMSVGFGVGDVVAVSNLCLQIYDRCKASRGEFREFSAQALSLRGTLTSIANLWEGQRLTDEERVELEAIALPLSESLRKLESQLRKYSSLGTRTPGICDQIGWAWDGREKLPQKIQDQIFPLHTLYTRQAKITAP